MSEDELAHLRRRVAELEIGREQVAELREQLEQAERELARIPVLEDEVQHQRRSAEIAKAERARFEAELLDLGDVRANLARAEKALHDVKGSASWRLTAPLRAAKQRGG